MKRSIQKRMMARSRNRKASTLSLSEGERLSISEPSLTDIHNTGKYIDRFVIKHPFEYIAVDDLKYFRKRQKSDVPTKSNIKLNANNNNANNIGNNDADMLPLNTEYKRQFVKWDSNRFRPLLPIRRSTSLHLEGLMPFNKTEYRDRFILYSLEDWKSCRTYPIRRPESLYWICDTINNKVNVKDMESKYKLSSHIMPPMLHNNSIKTIPHDNAKSNTLNEIVKNETESNQKEMILQETSTMKSSGIQFHYKDQSCNKDNRDMSSEYREQFIRFPIEKAHSIPQISHLKIQGNFQGVPEYRHSYKSHKHYVRPITLKKENNLLVFDSRETNSNGKNDLNNILENREQIQNSLNVTVNAEKTLKVTETSQINKKDTNESDQPQLFNAPIVERVKCSGSNSRLKGKIEFDPEYSNVHLDFPRSRPVEMKPVCHSHLPSSNTLTTDAKSRPKVHCRCHKSAHPSKVACIPKHEDECNNDSDTSTSSLVVTDIGVKGITTTPEYRRATYNYQIRERSPAHKNYISKSVTKHPSKLKFTYPRSSANLVTNSTTANTNMNLLEKPGSLKQLKPDINGQPSSTALANYGTTKIRKSPKFGRRASVMRNIGTHEKKMPAITEKRNYKYNPNSIHDSFLILDNHISTG